jgi:hypothetical protein
MSINKHLVATFQLLQKYENETTKFTKLAHLYGTLKFNDKLLLKFVNDFKANKDDISKLTYFKNTTIDDILNNISNEDKQHLISHLKNAYNAANKSLVSNGHHQCGSNCNHNAEKMLGNKKLQKMLKKKGVKQQLQAQLGKQFGMKNENIEDMLKKALKDELPDDQFSMISSMLNNPAVKNVTDKLLTEENLNKMKDIFTDIMADDEIVVEINKIKEIFNEAQIMKVLTDLFETVKNLDDITNIQSKIEGNPEITTLISKFETAMKSGLINEAKITTLAQKAGAKFFEALKDTNILDSANMGMLNNLMGDFGLGNVFGGKQEKKLSKEERKQRRLKNNRRKLRAEIKKKNNKRKKH